jgi:hypothetical protein
LLSKLGEHQKNDWSDLIKIMKRNQKKAEREYRNSEFGKLMQWFKLMRKAYDNQYIAYTKKDGGYFLLASAKEDEELKKKIKELWKQKKYKYISVEKL